MTELSRKASGAMKSTGAACCFCSACTSRVIILTHMMKMVHTGLTAENTLQVEQTSNVTPHSEGEKRATPWLELG